MNTTDIARMWPEIERDLKQFDPCFSRVEPRAHLRTYVRGQLSDIPRKSIEPIALTQGTPPRTLQKFLAQHVWDEDGMRNRLQRLVAAEHADERAVGVIDETSHPKKGCHTPGVKRQYCGATGKIDNCTVSVHLAYAGDGMRLLLDADLFVPEEWADDTERRREAGIPGSVVHRTKCDIALALLDRALGNGVHFRWLTFDEGYGQSPEFLHALTARNQRYVAEVPVSMHGWVREPRVMQRDHGKRTGRPRRMPRVFVQDSHVSSVRNLFRHSPAFTRQAWIALYVKDTTKGPVVWEIKESPFWLRREGVPTAEHRLVVARNALTSEIKYFVTNATASVRIEEIMSVAFTRWTVERCFEDAKTELGLSHFEVRNWTSLMRHLLITSVGLLLLSRVTKRHCSKSADGDALSGPHRGGRVDARAVDDTEQAGGVPGARRRHARAVPDPGARRIRGASSRDHQKTA